MDLKIINAIKAKSVLKVNYKMEGERLIEPFCYGVGSTGNELLRAWQVSGFSNHPGKLLPWRLFVVGNMSEIQVTEENFEGKRPNYNANDSAMTEIYCHV